MIDRWMAMRRRLAVARRSCPPHQLFRMACATRRYAPAWELAGLQQVVSFQLLSRRILGKGCQHPAELLVPLCDPRGNLMLSLSA